MEYSVVLKGQTYELPKKTLAIASKFEEVAKAAGKISDIEMFKRKYKLLQDVLGNTAVSESIGELNDCDANDIDLAFLFVIDAYNRPIADYRKQQFADLMNDKNLKEAANMIADSGKIAPFVKK